MASFADAHRRWADLDAAARADGSKALRRQAEQARQQLTKHPSVKDARDFNSAREANRKRGWL